jgi:hypothetical protein
MIARLYHDQPLPLRIKYNTRGRSVLIPVQGSALFAAIGRRCQRWLARTQRGHAAARSCCGSRVRLTGSSAALLLTPFCSTSTLASPGAVSNGRLAAASAGRIQAERRGTAVRLSPPPPPLSPRPANTTWRRCAFANAEAAFRDGAPGAPRQRPEGRLGTARLSAGETLVFSAVQNKGACSWSERKCGRVQWPPLHISIRRCHRFQGLPSQDRLLVR